MNDSAKVKADHLRRAAVTYVRQSTVAQTRFNTESLERQYELPDRLLAWGWSADQIRVVDADLGQSGAQAVDREGFKALVAEVALGNVGIVLGVEVSRLARNNSDWYQLLDLCSLTSTLIADADGVYDPADYSDRLVLGLKGTISEAELHLIRGRLIAGVRHKAAKGELRLVLPVGFAYDPEGRVVMSPDEAVRDAVAAVFARFAELRSARAVTLSLLDDGLLLPRGRPGGRVEWRPAGLQAVTTMLTNPVYAGVFAYGRTRTEFRPGPLSTTSRRRVLPLPPEQWRVFIAEHHPAYVSVEEYRANVAQLARNAPVPVGGDGAAARQGSALLQGLVRCGRCGQMMRTAYRSLHACYRCEHKTDPMVGRVSRCQQIGGRQLDEAVLAEMFKALEPAAVAATAKAIGDADGDRAARLAVFETALERARYEAERARRQFDTCEPENRLVARSLEAAWERGLVAVGEAEGALAAQQHRQPAALNADELAWLSRAGADLAAVFWAPSTTTRDRKLVVRTVIREVGVTVDNTTRTAEVRIAWEGGAITTMTIAIQRPGPSHRVTDEDTVALVRRLVAFYDDTTIATILARQHRLTASGLPYTKGRVADLRRAKDIPVFVAVTPSGDDEEMVNVTQAATQLGVSAETIYRWLASGFIAGEQLTPGAPWRIRLNDELRSKVTDEIPPGWLPLGQAAKALGVARQTVLHKVQRGELNAVQVRRGQRSGLRIQVKPDQAGLFDEHQGERVQS